MIGPCGGAGEAGSSKKSEVDVGVFLVRVVAEGSVLAAFAQAQDVHGGGRSEFDGFKFGALVGAVAEGLRLGQSARAVLVFLSDF